MLPSNLLRGRCRGTKPSRCLKLCTHGKHRAQQGLQQLAGWTDVLAAKAARWRVISPARTPIGLGKVGKVKPAKPPDAALPSHTLLVLPE